MSINSVSINQKGKSNIFNFKVSVKRDSFSNKNNNNSNKESILLTPYEKLLKENQNNKLKIILLNEKINELSLNNLKSNSKFEKEKNEINKFYKDKIKGYQNLIENNNNEKKNFERKYL